ncbi:hypothetical protein INT48_009162 [Thamnidium elegans]|uniref:Uncharacterized protein n=1 Tax=Thamnidium elegans TaxID=101142 RepID=A0A8H7VY67_9FUNG|nr:hypothetical protein INT48_009162 [Thamnidium elegans]
MTTSTAHTQPQLQPQQQLPPGSNFSDAFWDGQNKGVEIIMSRLRKSKDTCEEIKKLYESRASIEQDYGERLLKLAQNSRIGEFEEDTFAETLLRIPSALETTARAHIDLAQQMKDHLEVPLGGFLKDQRDVRKVQQQHIENSRQLKNLHEADVARARDYYSIECEKLASMENYCLNLGKDKSEEDIEKEIEEQKRMVTVADQVYRRSVDNFNSVNERWVTDWTSCADKFQEMEIKRMSYLRSTLWTTFSIDEECCDRIRTALEITDVQKDITSFVQRYGTGTRIPGPFTHEAPCQATQVHNVPIVAEVTTVSSSTPIMNHIDHHSLAPVKKTSLESLPERGASESTATSKPVTILTNPDEELKSVDRQLQQLEVHTTPHTETFLQTSPQQYTQTIEAEESLPEQQQHAPLSSQPMSGVTNNTDQSNGPVSTAIKEVEQILNIRGFTATSEDIVSPDHTDALVTKNVISKKTSYGSNNQTIPPVMMALPTTTTTTSRPTSHVVNDSDDFSAGIYDALGLNNQQSSQYDTSNHAPVQLAPLSTDTSVLLPASCSPSTESNQQTQKYKPMPNPVFANRQNSANSSTKNKEDNNNTRLPLTTRSSSLISPNSPHQVEEEDEQDKENKEYQNRMPRLPPKDEKWVISSIRRPQQLPVRTLNATMFDGTTSISRNSVLGVASAVREQQPAPEAPQPSAEEELNNTETPYLPKVHRPTVPLTIDIPNSVKPTTVEPPRAIAQQVIDEGRRLSQMSPVQQKMDLNNTISFNQQQPADRNLMHGYMNQNEVEDGGIRPAPWQEGITPEDRMIPKNGSYRGTPVMNGQGYYGNGHTSFQPGMAGPQEDNKKKFTKNNGKQYSESSIKSKEKESKTGRFSLGFFTEFSQSDIKSTHSNNQVTPPTQTTSQAHVGTPYIGYAKAQWPFEATINGELSFQVDEVVGIIRKQTDGWWEAERLGATFAGQRGLVPGNYMVEATHSV